MRYAELHAHTAFSLLDGAALPEPLVERAKELGLAALAITDHDELGGIVRFATAAREAELPAIIGAELTVASRGPKPEVRGPTGSSGVGRRISDVGQSFPHRFQQQRQAFTGHR